MIMMHLDQTNFVPPTWSGGYTAYRDSDSRVILDVDEEREAIRRAMEVAFRQRLSRSKINILARATSDIRSSY